MLTSALEQMFSDFSVCQKNPEGLLKYRSLGLPTIVSESEDLRWVQRTGLSNEFPGGAAAAGSWDPEPENHWSGGKAQSLKSQVHL